MMKKRREMDENFRHAVDCKYQEEIKNNSATRFDKFDPIELRMETRIHKRLHQDDDR